LDRLQKEVEEFSDITLNGKSILGYEIQRR